MKNLLAVFVLIVATAPAAAQYQQEYYPEPVPYYYPVPVPVYYPQPVPYYKPVPVYYAQPVRYPVAVPYSAPMYYSTPYYSAPRYTGFTNSYPMYQMRVGPDGRVYNYRIR